MTAIQLATAYAAIANGGVWMRPFVVKAAYDAARQQDLHAYAAGHGPHHFAEVAHRRNLLLTQTWSMARTVPAG